MIPKKTKKKIKKIKKKLNSNERTKLPFKKKIKIKLKELPALLRAKKEEKKHIPTDKEIVQEQHEFEKYALSMKKLILKGKRKRK